MITNNQYKIIAGQIAKLFCNTDLICESSVKERILINFNNETFATFLNNIQYGRFYILQYSNWRVHNNHCRNMAITAKRIDAITGELVTQEWYYDNADCSEKQFYFPDLNTLISRKGFQLIDAPIKNKTTAEIVKPRLVYNKNAASYGITYTPSTPGGGGGGGVQITPPVTPPVTLPNQPTEPPVNNNFNIEGLLSNPILLIGIAAAAYFLLIKK